MEHCEYRREVDRAQVAVLFVHGILGTPNHFADFIPYVPSDWSVCNILLDGHGGSADDFADSSMDIWKEQVENEIAQLLARHSYVVMATHSMGGLFAVKMSIKYGDRIKGLFLLNPPFKIGVSKSILETGVAVLKEKVFGEESSDHRVLATKYACSVEPTPMMHKYLRWAGNYLNLFKEEKDSRRFVNLLAVRTVVVISVADELVSTKTADYVNNDNITTIILENSTHFYYPKEDGERLCTAFGEFVHGVCHDIILV